VLELLGVVPPPELDGRALTGLLEHAGEAFA
jgi:hypothetical protein